MRKARGRLCEREKEKKGEGSGGTAEKYANRPGGRQGKPDLASGWRVPVGQSCGGRREGWMERRETGNGLIGRVGRKVMGVPGVKRER